MLKSRFLAVLFLSIIVLLPIFRIRDIVSSACICGTENPAEEEICHECGAYRYEEAYDAISDEEDEIE